MCACGPPAGQLGAGLSLHGLNHMSGGELIVGWGNGAVWVTHFSSFAGGPGLFTGQQQASRTENRMDECNALSTEYFFLYIQLVKMSHKDNRFKGWNNKPLFGGRSSEVTL